MSFSLSRFTDLWSFYHPRMLRMWLITGGLLVLAYIGLVMNYLTGELFLYSLFSAIAGYMVFASPFVFALGRHRELELQLPASAAERCALMTIFCFVVTPIGIALFWELLQMIGVTFGLPNDIIEKTSNLYVTSEIVGEAQEVQEMTEAIYKHAKHFQIGGYLANITPLACGLYAAIVARKSPIFATIGGLFAGFILICIEAILLGVWAGFREAKSLNLDNFNDTEALNFATTIMVDVVNWLAICGGIMVVVSIPIIYYKIKKAQI